MMSNERVLFVDHTGQIGGAELILLDVIDGRHESSVFLFETGPLSKAVADKRLNIIASKWGNGLSQFHRDSSPLSALPLAGRMAAIVFEIARAARRHDIVYANSQKAFILASIASVIARRPLIWHLHDIISSDHFGATQRRAQVLLANACATRVIVPSEVAATAFIDAGGKRDLVDVVPNGLAIQPDPSSPDELRQGLGLPAGSLVGVFSRLAAWKGQHVLIEAVARLPGVNCIIVGDALFGEQDYAARLNKMVADLGVVDRIRFLGHRNDVPKLMKAVDVMVHPSIDPEPFGRTLVEAMLAGVPVVATNAGAAPDILEGGKAGTLVPPNDAAALASAISTVLAKPEQLSGQLEYASVRARVHYGLKQMLDTIGLVIRKAQAGALA
ncbi:glycosyltransferase family 1 protein [Bradyrhizobium guangdongense]|uniref:glycosyltransferase n=1 Tax=Bradyrhizobium guangdongense TaxID=1325090 RepID=UPI00112A3BFD|nr:glycosyltransferase [Bradyrhizobium guangdongense]TPQ38272.1 glycosyltransferase family 1 protein [Bradyrhizobium guangdongense]